MNLNLENKIYIISGSSRGIGKGIAEVLLHEGASVVLTGRDVKSLDMTFNLFNEKFKGKVLKFAGDLNSVEILNLLEKMVIENYSHVDGIIANAGAVKPVHEWGIDERDWDWYFESNVKISIRFVSKFIPYLIKTSGNVVFISSIAGLEDIGAPLPYSAGKAAITMYAKGLARRLSPFGIRVNTIAPGNIIFPGGNWDKRRNEDPDGIQKMLNDRVPLKMFGSPEDIGNSVAFLLSEKAKFTTGSCLVVDGGQTTCFI